LDTGSKSAAVGAVETAVGAKVPATLRDPGAIRFWIAIVLTGLCAGLGAALLTLLFDAAQALAWGAAEPSALLEAAWQASPQRHLGLLFGAGIAISLGQVALTRLTTGNGIDVTSAIWFHAGRMPAWRTLGTAVLSIVIVGMGAPLGREGAPKQFGVVFGNLFSSLQRLSDEQRRLIVSIGAGAGMAAVYSVPLGGALFALEVLRGALALRLVIPALAAALIATTTASFVVPNAPLYTVPAYPISREVYLWTIIASPIIGLWSVAFVRAIAWAYSVRPSGWGRFLAPPLVLGVVGLISVIFPEVLGNGQGVAQLLFLHPLEPVALAVLVLVRPIATVGAVASGAPGGLFTPSLAAGALAGSSGRRHRPLRASGRGCDAGGVHPGTHLFAGAHDGVDRPRPGLCSADDRRDRARDRDRASHRVALGLRSTAHRRGSGGTFAGARAEGRVSVDHLIGRRGPHNLRSHLDNPSVVSVWLTPRQSCAYAWRHRGALRQFSPCRLSVQQEGFYSEKSSYVVRRAHGGRRYYGGWGGECGSCP
jgi:CIC family chloride channel protein